MVDIKKSLYKGFWCVIFLVLTSIPAYSFTWNDVQNAYLTTTAGCTNWIEEVLVNNGRGYRVWKRCSGDAVAFTKNQFTGGSVISNSTSAQCPGGNCWAVRSCNCTSATTLVSNLQGYYDFGVSGAGYFSFVTKCTGSITSTLAGSASAYGVSSPCCAVSLPGVDCRSYDTLLGEFAPITSECSIGGYTSSATNKCVGIIGQASLTCGCSCIPEGYSLTGYTDTNGDGIRQYGDTCIMSPTVGELTNTTKSTGGSGSTGGSFNRTAVPNDGTTTTTTETTQSTTGTTPTPGQTVNNTTNNTTTTTTTTIGGVSSTTSTSTGTSKTDRPGAVSGSEIYTTTTTNAQGNSTTTKTGCIDTNGDGLDDGSGLECSPTARTFTPTTPTYDTTLEPITENSIPSLLTGYLSTNPYVSVVNGTRVQAVDSQCSLSTTIFGKVSTIDFCPLGSYVDLFGYFFFALAGFRSVFIAMGVD